MQGMPSEKQRALRETVEKAVHNPSIAVHPEHLEPLKVWLHDVVSISPYSLDLLLKKSIFFDAGKMVYRCMCPSISESYFVSDSATGSHDGGQYFPEVGDDTALSQAGGSDDGKCFCLNYFA